MVEVYSKDESHRVSLSEWLNCYESAVSGIANNSYKNRYAAAGFTASYTIHDKDAEGKPLHPDHMYVTFQIHAPDNLNGDSPLVEQLRNNLNGSQRDWTARSNDRSPSVNSR